MGESFPSGYDRFPFVGFGVANSVYGRGTWLQRRLLLSCPVGEWFSLPSWGGLTKKGGSTWLLVSVRWSMSVLMGLV